MEINQMLKRQEHFFQSQKTKDYEFSKESTFYVWNMQSKSMKKKSNMHCIKILGKSCFESYMTEIGMVKSELSYIKKNSEKMDETRTGKNTTCPVPIQKF